MKNSRSVFLILLFVLLLSACGRNRDEINNEESYGETGETIIGGVDVPEETIDGLHLTERILTVRTTAMFSAVVEQAAMELNESWAERGKPYFLILNIEEHEDMTFTGDIAGWHASIEARDARFRVELMSGIVPDLVFNDDFTLFTGGFYHQFALGGHLMCFYTLIDNCNYTSRDDFFMNAIEARRFMDGVFELPMLFGFNYIGINNSIPQHFIDRFTALSGISMSDMQRLYLELLENYTDQFGGMNTGLEIISPLNSFTLNLSNSIDFDTLTANFVNPELIQSMELERTFATRRNWPMFVTIRPSILDMPTLREYAATDMFLGGWDGLGQADAFFYREGVPFTHFIPLTDDYGRLIISQPAPMARPNVDPSVWIPAAGDTDLAWEFTRYLIKAFSQPIGRAATLLWGYPAPWGSNTLRVPIMRSLFESHMQSVFENLAGINERRMFGFNTGAEFEREAEIAVARIYRYSNMPTTILPIPVPPALILPVFEEFELGIITAEAALTRMQNSVRLWLIE